MYQELFPWRDWIFADEFQKFICLLNRQKNGMIQITVPNRRDVVVQLVSFVGPVRDGDVHSVNEYGGVSPGIFF